MSDERISLTMDQDPAIARLIIETAQWQSRCSPVGVKPEDWSVSLTADHVRDSANLVFLALALIAERRQ